MNLKESPSDRTLQESRDLHTWIFVNLEPVRTSKVGNLRLAVPAFDLALDFFTGITSSVEMRAYGSAFALVRPLFETFVKAVWLKDCATDKEIEAFEKDKLSKKFGEILVQVEGLETFRHGALSDLKKQAWSAMSGYTHGGIHQIGRRVKGNAIDSNYADGEIIEVLRLGQMFALMSFIQIVLIGGREDLSRQAIQKLYELELFEREW